VIAWIAPTPRGRAVWVSIRPPGGRFGAVHLVSRTANALQVSAAVGIDGKIVVAFPSRHGRMLATVKRPGRSWGALQDLGPASSGTETDVTPAVLFDGRVLVAWYHTQLCEGGCVSPGFTRVAIEGARASRFSAAQLLERDPAGLAGAPSGMRLAPVVLPLLSGPVLLAFLGQPSGAYGGFAGLVRVSHLRGSRFGAPQTVSDPARLAGGLAGAVGVEGAILTWVAQDTPPGTGAVFGSPSDSMGLFGAPEQISPDEHVLAAAAVYDATGAHWLVAWTSRPQTESQTVVRVATGR
jgi:hypothetical protein